MSKNKKIIKKGKKTKLDKNGFLVSNLNIFNIQKEWIMPIEDFLNVSRNKIKQ